VPSGKVQSWAIEALKEEGIDISKHWSKSIDQLSPAFTVSLDYVITLCAEEICPMMVSKAKQLHWPIPDPARALGDNIPAAYRNARDAIRSKLNDFEAEIR
jgi:arsenate reductase